MTTKLLSTYTPAETHVLIHGQAASLKDLLKVTFMDLLMKQVLKTVIVERQPHYQDPVTTFKYIAIGKNFYTHQILPHEWAFLSPFHQDASTQILFQNMVKIGYQKGGDSQFYQNQVIRNDRMVPLFYKDFFQRIFRNQSGYSLTQQGTATRQQVVEELKQLEQDFPQWIQTDKEKALHVSRLIKGNLFLLTTVSFELLKEIDTELLAELNQETKEAASSSGGCSGCGTVWGSFGDCSDSFDSSCGNACGSDGSGDGGGDSGCSGCSGCGGGCGGGD